MRRIFVSMLVLAIVVVATVVGAIMIRANGEQHPESALTNATNPVGSNMAGAEPSPFHSAGNERASSIAAAGTTLDVDVVTEAEIDAVRDLENTAGALDAMKLLAAKGNEYAMVRLGDGLLECSPRGLELYRYRMAQDQRYVERLKSRLMGSESSPPAPAASIDGLTAAIVSSESMTALTSEVFDEACRQLAVDDTSSGFDWLSRAADRGYKQARMTYIEKAVRFFGNARQVARYPQQAIASRNQARIYLEQIRAECTRDALRDYAWWSVALYKLDVEERYATVTTWLQATHESNSEDAVGSWGSSQEEALQQLTTQAQKQRAEQRVKAWLDRCGNS